MPDFVRLLTDDQNRITHMMTADEDVVTMEELAQMIDDGEDCYVDFGGDNRFELSMVAEDGDLEPTFDDPDGEYTIWDLPQEEDPAEEEIEEIFDEMERSGEFETEPDRYDPNRAHDEEMDKYE